MGINLKAPNSRFSMIDLQTTAVPPLSPFVKKKKKNTPWKTLQQFGLNNK